MQTLGAAVAALKLKPGAAWRHAVVAAAHSKLPSCSMQQLVQLLLGVTAGGFNPKENWWRAWFAATMRKCEGLLGPQTGPECVASPPAAAAATATNAVAEVDSASIAPVSSSTGAAMPAAEGSSHSSDRSPGSRQGPGMSEVKAGGDAGGASSTRQWQRRLQPGDLLPAAMLSTVCMVLLQLGRQVHPLWMAAMLEAQKRWVGCRAGPESRQAGLQNPVTKLKYLGSLGSGEGKGDSGYQPKAVSSQQLVERTACALLFH